MERISIEEFNILVKAGQLAHSPVCDNTTQFVKTELHEEDEVEVFMHGCAIAVYWISCGHFYSVYVVK